MPRGVRRPVRMKPPVPMKRTMRTLVETITRGPSKGLRRSPVLVKQPSRIVLIDEHDYAGVGTKLASALKTEYNTVQFLSLRRGVSPQRFLDAFGPPSEYNDVLLLFIEPGSGAYQPNLDHAHWLRFGYKGASRPLVPFGVYWCGSLCRVDNMDIQYGQTTEHSRWLRGRRDYIDSLTPLRLCATECLERIGLGHEFVGQPYKFPDTIPEKVDQHKIIHTPTAPFKTNCFKGTDNIDKAFSLVRGDRKCKVVTEIIKFGTSNTDIISKLSNTTMYAMTMTDWDSGTGYGGIEALANGCLVFSKKPNNTDIRSPIIHAKTPKELYLKIYKYSCDRSLYESRRMAQFKWAKETFSPEVVAKRIRQTIQSKINKGWV